MPMTPVRPFMLRTAAHLFAQGQAHAMYKWYRPYSGGNRASTLLEIQLRKPESTLLNLPSLVFSSIAVCALTAPFLIGEDFLVIFFGVYLLGVAFALGLLEVVVLAGVPREEVLAIFRKFPIIFCIKFLLYL